MDDFSVEPGEQLPFCIGVSGRHCWLVQQCYAARRTAGRASSGTQFGLETSSNYTDKFRRSHAALSTRNNRHADSFHTAAPQRGRGFAARGAGCNDIVDQKDASARQIVAFPDPKSAANVGESLSAEQAALLPGATLPDQRPPGNGDPQSPGQRGGYKLWAVRAAQQSPRPVHGDRHEQVGLDFRELRLALGNQQLAHRQRQRFLPDAFHPQDNLPQWTAVVAQRKNPIESQADTTAGGTSHDNNRSDGLRLGCFIGGRLVGWPCVRRNGLTATIAAGNPGTDDLLSTWLTHQCASRCAGSLGRSQLRMAAGTAWRKDQVHQGMGAAPQSLPRRSCGKLRSQAGEKLLHHLVAPRLRATSFRRSRSSLE